MITLYYAPDNASLIIRIILEELGLAYKTVLVDRSTKAHTQTPYLKLNPNGLIPVCVINDEPIFETAAIALLLADAHSKMTVESNKPQRSPFLAWLFFLSNSLHTDLRQRFYPQKYVGSQPQALKAFRDVTLQRLLTRLSILETQYAKTDHDYLFGQQPTIIDVYLAVCLRWAQLYPADDTGQIKLQNYPSIKEMLLQLETREFVKSACEKEGITGAIFSKPAYSDPPEGVAL